MPWPWRTSPLRRVPAVRCPNCGWGECKTRDPDLGRRLKRGECRCSRPSCRIPFPAKLADKGGRCPRCAALWQAIRHAHNWREYRRKERARSRRELLLLK